MQTFVFINMPTQAIPIIWTGSNYAANYQKFTVEVKPKQWYNYSLNKETMKKVYVVITDNGDGSNSLEWHKTMSPEKEEQLMDNDEYGKYTSGDGFQCTELQLPEGTDLDTFAFFNNITWFEDTVED